jgi:hypothetical protein
LARLSPSLRQLPSGFLRRFTARQEKNLNFPFDQSYCALEVIHLNPE